MGNKFARIIQAIFVNALISLTLFLLLIKYADLQQVENQIQLIFYKLKRHTIEDKSVVIVEASENGDTKDNDSFWNVEYLGEIITQISKMNPKVIGVEILVSCRDCDVESKYIQSLINAKRLVSGYSQRSLDYKYGFAHMQGENMTVGNLDEFDMDMERILSIRMCNKSKNDHQESFSKQIATMYLEKATMRDSMCKEKHDIFYYGPQNTFMTITAQDAMSQNQFLPIKGKAVIISASSFQEKLLTPYGYMTKAEIRANAIQNIINNDHSGYGIFANSLAVTLISMVCYFYRKQKIVYEASMFGFALIVYNTFSYILFVGGNGLLSNMLMILVYGVNIAKKYSFDDH